MFPRVPEIFELYYFFHASTQLDHTAQREKHVAILSRLIFCVIVQLYTHQDDQAELFAVGVLFDALQDLVPTCPPQMSGSFAPGCLLLDRTYRQRHRPSLKLIPGFATTSQYLGTNSQTAGFLFPDISIRY